MYVSRSFSVFYLMPATIVFAIIAFAIIVFAIIAFAIIAFATNL
jgi:hypothetical protein